MTELPAVSRYPLRVGIVGFGYWGPNLLRNFSEHPDASVVWVCDIDEERLRLARRRMPSLRTTDTVDDVLADDVDLVAFATPVNTHYTLAMRALEAGKHILVEKPLCTSVTEAEEIECASLRAKKMVFLDHTFVFTPAVQKMAEIANDSAFGKLLYYDSVRVNLGLFQSDISVLWDLAPHDLSILDYLLGGLIPKTVGCVGARHFGDVENIAYLTLRYGSDFMAHIHLNWLAPVKIRQVLLGGSQRLLLYNDLDSVEKIRVFDKSILIENHSVGTRHRQLVEYRLGDMYAPMISTTEALKIEVDHIVNCLLRCAQPISGISAGKHIVEILEAAEKSLRNEGAPEPIGTRTAVR
ncbi:MAG: Gfo/Idh/MocA family oxidoreductase [Candidatus Eremiobacteraeota bacterium]|nr:Gfo/Idh/MocA family oxidoreductase [Candidatus Eremiobacteraeota bacterium]